MRMAHQSFCHIAISEIFKKTVIRLTPTSICYVLYFVHKECLLCIADLYLCWLIKNLVAEVGVEPTIAFAVVMSHASVPRLVSADQLNFKELLKIVLGVIIEYFVHPTNKVYHFLTPQPRSFLRELPTLGAFWLYTLHQVVFPR